MQHLDLADRPIAMELAGVLRLANALDATHQNRPHEEKSPPLEIIVNDSHVVVRVPGYSALDRAAEEVAAARHLLETVLRRPVLVRPLRISGVSSRASAVSKAKTHLALIKGSQTPAT